MILGFSRASPWETRTMKKGDSVLNSTKGKRERIGRMMMMHSNNREEIEEAFAGDIIALAGLKETTTGDTIVRFTVVDNNYIHTWNVICSTGIHCGE